MVVTSSKKPEPGEATPYTFRCAASLGDSFELNRLDLSNPFS